MLHELSPVDGVRIAALTDQFHRALSRDTKVLSSVVRALEAPRGPARVDAERFRQFIIDVVKKEMNP